MLQNHNTENVPLMTQQSKHNNRPSNLKSNVKFTYSYEPLNWLYP